MPSRERRLLDKDKEIRKLKNNLGHYFTNSIVLGIKNEKLRQQLHIAVETLKDFTIHSDKDVREYAKKALERIKGLDNE